MNTFMPYGFCPQSVAVLDDKRLQKQLVECQQIYDALITQSPAHILHHPATQMWAGRVESLLLYSQWCYCEWRSRNNNKQHKSGEYLASRPEPPSTDTPPWADDLAPFHKERLYRKDPEHYANLAGGQPHHAWSAYPIVSASGAYSGKFVYRDTSGPWTVLGVQSLALCRKGYYPSATAWAAICAARSA